MSFSRNYYPSSNPSSNAIQIGVELPPREVNARDPRSTLQAIFRRWLPLSDAILRMVVRCVPSPVEAQAKRLPTLLDSSSQTRSAGSVAAVSPALLARMATIKNSVGCCNSKGDAEVVIFVSKMIPVKMSELAPRDAELFRQRAALKAQSASGDVPTDSSATNLREDDEVFLALGRVFSGQVTRDSNLFVLSNRHDPLVAAASLDSSEQGFDGEVPPELAATATRLTPQSIGLYLCLGPSVTPVDSVSAGNIVAIAGLDQLILKTATVSSSWACQPLRAMTFQARPMVRVAVEPRSHLDLGRLERGLASLYQYDPAVEVGTDEMGQHTVSCLGELHLEQCLKSLTDRFAK